jgi:hypothetical protein
MQKNVDDVVVDCFDEVLQKQVKNGKTGILRVDSR